MSSVLVVVVTLLGATVAVKLVKVMLLAKKLRPSDDPPVEVLLTDNETTLSHEEMLSHEAEFPTTEREYHGHPKYILVFVGLMLLFIVSLLGDLVPNKTAMVLLIFGTALVKSILVIAKFMHLQFEPKLILIFVIAVAFCLAAFYFGIYTDIVLEDLDLVK